MIDTFSIFYYGGGVTDENRYLNFNEGGPELSAVLDIGSYALTQLMSKVKLAMDDVGALTYSVSLDRTTRLVTISSSSNFSLLVSTGSNAGFSVFALLGFTGANRTGASTYTGNLPCGFEYEPQFKLQSYVDKNHSQKYVDPVISESASGIPEVVKFGVKKYYKFNIAYISDLSIGDNRIIKNNSSGVSDAVSFMEYIVTRSPIEIMPSINDRATFDYIILEKTQESDKGTDFELKEFYSKGLKDIFETGILTFRVV